MQIKGLVAAVDAAGVDGADPARTRFEKVVDVVDVVGEFLQPQPAILFIVAVPASEIDVAVADIVEGDHLLDAAHLVRFDDLAHLLGDRAEPQREGDDGGRGVVLVGGVEAAHLVEGD